MHSVGYFENTGLRFANYDGSPSGSRPSRLIRRRIVLGAILVVALLAFELFNFDTTRYALQYMLGEVSFWGMRWATILAVAFCAIDFAGLARLFTPERGAEERRAVWFLMGAWLLGATMNAVMTWWAVSLTLLSHDFGNEVLGRDQLLRIVPMFVAALVWLIRVLFIGALSVAGEHLFEVESAADPETTIEAFAQDAESDARQPITLGKTGNLVRAPTTPSRRPPAPARHSWPRQAPPHSRPVMASRAYRSAGGIQAQQNRR